MFNEAIKKSKLNNLNTLFIFDMKKAARRSHVAESCLPQRRMQNFIILHILKLNHRKMKIVFLYKNPELIIRATAICNFRAAAHRRHGRRRGVVGETDENSARSIREPGGEPREAKGAVRSGRAREGGGGGAVSWMGRHAGGVLCREPLQEGVGVHGSCAPRHQNWLRRDHLLVLLFCFLIQLVDSIRFNFR